MLEAARALAGRRSSSSSKRLRVRPARSVPDRNGSHCELDSSICRAGSTGDIAGKQRGGCGKRPLFAQKKVFPKTSLVVRRRSETTCRTLGRFNRTRSSLPERKYRKRVPANSKRRTALGRAATDSIRRDLVREPVGFTCPEALPFSAVGCADPKKRRNSSNPAFWPRSRSGGVPFSPAPGFRFS